MFKKFKENYNIPNEMIDFFNRQLAILREIAHKLPHIDTQLATEQIKDCTTLIEKRLIIAIDHKTTQDFHDYVSDFYEDKLEKMRKELNKQLLKNKQLTQKMQEAEKSFRMQQQALLKSKPKDFSLCNDMFLIKKQLVHSQKLIQQNQQVIEEQNRLIEQLNKYVQKVEERERKSVQNLEKKAKQLDQVINSKKKKLNQMTKDLELQTKKLDRQFRELQLTNISFLEGKEALEAEVLLKSEEINLLTKKIYDQNLIITKFERQLHANQSIFQEQKIGTNRLVDDNRKLKQKIRQNEKDFHSKIDYQQKEMRILQEKLNKSRNQQEELEALSTKHLQEKDRVYEELTLKVQELKELERQLFQFELKFKEIQKQNRKLQKKDKQNRIQLSQCQENIQEKQREIEKYKNMLNNARKDTQNNILNYQREKEAIRNDIQQDLNHLIKLNNEMLLAVEKSEKENNQVRKQNQVLLGKVLNLNQTIFKLEQSFEQARKMIVNIEQQKQDLDQLRTELENKLKTSEKNCQEYIEFKLQHQIDIKRNEQLQQHNHNLKKTLQEKQAEALKFKNLANERVVKQREVDSENIKQLKEQLCRKQFMNRQINAKLSEVQAQLRESTKRHDREKEVMSVQIKQLQKIIQDNFDHSNNSNRLIDSTIV